MILREKKHTTAVVAVMFTSKCAARLAKPTTFCLCSYHKTLQYLKIEQQRSFRCLLPLVRLNKLERISWTQGYVGVPCLHCRTDDYGASRDIRQPGSRRTIIRKPKVKHSPCAAYAGLMSQKHTTKYTFRGYLGSSNIV